MKTLNKTIIALTVAAQTLLAGTCLAAGDAEYMAKLKRSGMTHLLAELAIQGTAVTANCTAATIEVVLAGTINTVPVVSLVDSWIVYGATDKSDVDVPQGFGGAAALVGDLGADAGLWLAKGEVKHPWSFVAASYAPTATITKQLYSESAGCVKHAHRFGAAKNELLSH